MSFITSPALFLFFLLLAAFFFRHTIRVRNLFLIIAVFFALLLTSRPIYCYVSNIWTKGFSSEVQKGKTYHYGIVLGGYGVWDAERNRPEFSQNVDRLLEGIQLYHKGYVQKLVIACDASNRITDDSDVRFGNPIGMRRYIERLGVAPSDLIMENKATTTRENAKTLLILLGDSLKQERSLLITSAEHMRRALMTFKQEGIPADGYATDCIVENRDKNELLPALSVMTCWQSLLHEIIGYLYYSI